jgi:hypothetical protein
MRAAGVHHFVAANQIFKSNGKDFLPFDLKIRLR